MSRPLLGVFPSLPPDSARWLLPWLLCASQLPLPCFITSQCLGRWKFAACDQSAQAFVGKLVDPRMRSSHLFLQCPLCCANRPWPWAVCRRASAAGRAGWAAPPFPHLSPTPVTQGEKKSEETGGHQTSFLDQVITMSKTNQSYRTNPLSVTHNKLVVTTTRVGRLIEVRDTRTSAWRLL